MKSTAPRPAMPKEVEALRTSLDSRLAALEKALADPTQHGSLEALILDLARTATEEADATARHAVVDAHNAAQSAAAAARSEALEALEAEKVESAALRQVIEQAKTALKQAETALKEERRSAEAANRDVAAANRELAAVRETLEQLQSAGASQRRELEVANAAVETARAHASAIEEQAAQARAHGESDVSALANDLELQRAALEAERASAAELRQASAQLEQDLANVRGELRASQAELDIARNELDGVRQDSEARTQSLSHSQAEQEAALIGAQDGARIAEAQLEQVVRERDAARGERDSARQELGTARHDLDAARRELDSVRRDSDAHAQTLSHSQAEQEQALKTALDGARSAEARVEQAIRERDAAEDESVALRRRLEEAEAAIRERDALERELQAAHQAHEARDAAEAFQAARGTVLDAELEVDSETVVDLTSDTKEEGRLVAFEHRIRTLELALRDAEMRAQSAELELDSHRRPAHDEAPSMPIEPIPVPDASEQFRGPARASKRVTLRGETEIQIDGASGMLVDLSLTGAQVLTESAMKPNRLITLTLPLDGSSIVCKAKIMWARLEPRAGQLWYRGGVAFTSADEAGIQALLAMHQK